MCDLFGDKIPKNQDEKKEQFALEFAHEPSLALSDFIVSEANFLAFEHIVSFPNWSTPMTLLLGPAKSGKSHLGRIWKEKSGAFIATNEIIETLAKEGGKQPILIENIDCEGFDEVGLFHLLNQSIRDSRPLLMTATKPISAWHYKTNDVLSRARLATSFSVDTPDDAQLSQMFAKLFDDRQVKVDPKIIAYLVSRMERSSEEVVILVALMDKIAFSKGKPISLGVASEALQQRSASFE
jgi:chromosomal replication initiation ATPase DnaA